MIQGRHDTYYTIDEFAAMVGRAPKTVTNWATEGKLQLVHLCGVPLISLRHVEQLISGRVPEGAEKGSAALRMMNRDNGQQPERHAPPSTQQTR